MKLTKNKLKELIAEELKNITQEDITNEGPEAARQHRQQASVPIAGGGDTPSPPGQPGDKPTEAEKQAGPAPGVELIQRQFATNKSLVSAMASVSTQDGVTQVLKIVSDLLQNQAVTPQMKALAAKTLYAQLSGVRK
jgi:hypothetical protein